ncbi:sodium-independent sulfate anion transporter [Halyomorpha halys]|uniref:sodium-independent sulfate anion transporter n=1 Tax=Halyomorpha halys TaxID=286706 RepID=UPI0006D4F312|nr:sodium-independent sulfate anion transporter-like [Halyomorpha halys]
MEHLQKHIPIVRWLRNYTKEDAICDFIAGISIGLTMIPQSIAYAALAGLTPQTGLNSAFMGCMLYAFLGTIKEVVIGPSSLMALLTYEYTHKLNLDFVVLLCYLCGIVEFVMGVFRLGFLVEFISAPVVSGFTTATSVIIVVSQMKGLIGVNFESNGFMDNIYQLFVHLHNIRWGDTGLGVICVIILLIMRKAKEVKVPEAWKYAAFIKKALWLLTLGRNFLIVVATSFIAYLYRNNGSQPPFLTSKPVKGGIPSLILPPFSTQIGNKTYEFGEMVTELGTGCIIIPIIAVLANVAIAKAFVNGPVEATHEMLTLSICNIIGSCVQSMPTAGAFTRSAVASASGVRTPIAGLYSASLIMMALSFLGPYFHHIPRATLSAVLIAAVIFLIDWKIFPSLWKKSWLDFSCVTVTLMSCLALGVEIGLLIGVLMGVTHLVYKSSRPPLNIKTGKEVVTISGRNGLYFPAADYFNDQIQKYACGFEVVFIDVSTFSGIDFTAAKGLASLINSFEKRKQKVVLVSVPIQWKELLLCAGVKGGSIRTEPMDNIDWENNQLLLQIEEPTHSETEQHSDRERNHTE